MRSVSRLLLILVLAAAAVTASGGDFTFVVMADPQIGFTNGNTDLTPEMDNFRKGIEQMNKLKPAFVIIAGDLVQSAHDPKQIRAFWQVAGEINPDIPLHLVAGNHDVGAATARSLRSYGKLFGPDHYAFTYGNSAFIVLDSVLIREPTADPSLRAEQRKWFEEQLATARDRKAAHVFVIAHHPWFVTSPDEPDDYYNTPLSVRREYLDLMKQYGADYALSGHLHHEASAKYDGIRLIATASVGKALGSDPVGFRVIRVVADRVEQEYVALSRPNR